MSTRRKPNRSDPRKHPGNDTLWVIWPDVALTATEAAGLKSVEDVKAWMEAHPPQVREQEVTRDEFVRRMSGCPDVLRLLHESGRDTRVISLADVDAIEQWAESAP